MNYDLLPKEKIKVCALLVNSKLDKYIELHDLILKKSGTFRSIIKNLVGVSVPFDQFVQRAEELEKELKTTIDGLHSTRNSIKTSMTPEEGKYMNCLITYAEKVHQTISALRDCQEAYYEKSKGDKLDWSTARRLEDLYKQSIDDYKEVGLQLNDLSYIIF